MTNTNQIATPAQLEQLRLHAVNDVTNEIAAHGIMLTHEQADDLGQEVLGWMGGRLLLNVRATDAGVECTPPEDYVGTDEDGNLVTADEAVRS